MLIIAVRPHLRLLARILSWDKGSALAQGQLGASGQATGRDPCPAGGAEGTALNGVATQVCWGEGSQGTERSLDCPLGASGCPSRSGLQRVGQASLDGGLEQHSPARRGSLGISSGHGGPVTLPRAQAWHLAKAGTQGAISS